MDSGHRQLDHTADLALEVWAPDEAGLLCAGARAVVEILTGGGDDIAGTARRDVVIDAVDGEDRLVQWLNEVLVAAVSEGFLFGSADIELDGAGLRARIRGESDAGDRVVTELKSVTYHDLELHGGDRGWRARVVIDV